MSKSIGVNKKLGVLLLAVWLILQGLGSLTSLSFSGMQTVMGVLALAAGAILIIDR